MKLMMWPEFSAMPEGTIYYVWRPAHFGDLGRKGRTIFKDGIPVDFIYTTCVPTDYSDSDGPVFEGDEDGDSGPYAAISPNLTYAVYEEADRLMLIRILGGRT